MSDEERRSMLVSPAELAAGLGYGESGYREPRDGSLAVIDCRFNLMQPEAGREAYLAGHIPGAHYADLDRDLAGARTAGSGRHPLPAPEDLRRRFAAWGIRAHTRVVAYDDAEAPSRCGSGGCCAGWAMSASHFSTAACLPGSARVCPRCERSGAGRRHGFRRRGGDDVSARYRRARRGRDGGKVTIVDVRAADRYLGRTEPIDPVAGHVPGALNVPFAGSLDGDGRFLPPAELRKRYQAILGSRRPDEVVFMCGSGITACHGIFTFELAGFPGAVLYPGSWSEWISDPARPVAHG